MKDKDHEDGFEQLRRHLYRMPRGAASRLAEKCGVNKSRISQIVNSRSKPSVDLAIAIETETGVDAALLNPTVKYIRDRDPEWRRSGPSR